LVSVYEIKQRVLDTIEEAIVVSVWIERASSCLREANEGSSPILNCILG
jgi:hypothetical protein